MSCVNRNPSLFDGVVLTAPFLNLQVLKDENQALTQSDWLEFGKWDNLIEADAMEKICPYSQIVSLT